MLAADRARYVAAPPRRSLYPIDDETHAGVRALIWILALLPFAALALRQWSYGYGLSAGDYAHYLLHAQAIATGRPYADIGYIYTPYNPWIGPPVQPPGFPLTLAPLLALFGPDMLPIRILIVSSALAFLVLAGRYFAARDGLAIGVATVLLTGTALQAMYATSNVLSDLGFCALVWGAITTFDAPGGWRWRRVLLAAVLVAAALAYRSAGAALLVAMPLYFLLTDRRHLLVPILTGAAVALAILLALATVTNVTSDLPLDVAGLARRVAANGVSYRFGFYEGVLNPTPWPAVNAAYHVIALPVVVIGAGHWIRRWGRTFLTAFVLGYGLMLLVVPVRETRYVWPLLPVLGAWFALGIRIIVAFAVRRGRRMSRKRVDSRARLAAVAVVAVVSVSAAVVHGLRPAPQDLTALPDVKQLFAAAAELREEGAPRVAFTNPRALAWHAGVPAMGLIAAPPDSTFMELRARRITHVVVGDLGLGSVHDAYMRRVIAAEPACFRRVFANPSFTMYAFTGRCAAGGGLRTERPSWLPGDSAAGSSVTGDTSCCLGATATRTSVAAMRRSGGRQHS